MDLLYGTESVYAAMQMKRRKVIGPLFVLEGKLPSESDSIGKGKSTVFKNILEIAQRDQIQIIRTSKHDLNLLAENRPHNGVVLKASPLRDLLEEEASDDAPLIRDQGGKIWVAVDQVMDPQNLGTIIRNSFYFGAEQVIICRKNSAPLSAVVSKSSVGAMEYMNLRFCRSMPRFLSVSFL
jgi:21S rRNA (GM2251-2'-O)-methyltransferase